MRPLPRVRDLITDFSGVCLFCFVLFKELGNSSIGTSGKMFFEL